MNERIKQYQKEWREKNKQYLSNYAKKRWQEIKQDKNRLEAHRKKGRDWYRNNVSQDRKKLDEINKKFKKRYRSDEKFRSKKIKQTVKYAKDNIEKKYEWNNKYFDRLNNADGGKITKQKRMKVFEMYNYQCAYCGNDENLSIDHKIPLILGGSNKIENLQILCLPCNCVKGAKPHTRKNVVNGLSYS